MVPNDVDYRIEALTARRDGQRNGKYIVIVCFP